MNLLDDLRWRGLVHQTTDDPGIGAWLNAEVEFKHIRDIPLPLLTQQLMSPVVLHMLVRRAMPHIPGVGLPDIETTCDTFADAFLRAVATTPPS